jgi:hypothetical protein
MSPRRSIRARAGWVGLLLLAGEACGDLPAEALGTTAPASSSTHDGDATSPAGTDSTTGGTAPLDEGSTSSSSSDSSAGSTSTSAGADTSTSTSDGSSSESTDTGEPLPACGDGRVAADELCHGLGPAIAVAPAPGRLALDDVDGDGDIDLVLANSSSPMVVVLWGVGDGNFVAPQPLLDAGAVVDDLVLVDLSGDGSPDLVVTDRLGSRVITFANDGMGTLFFAGQYPAELAPVRLATGEIDADAIPDLVALSTTSAAVMRGNGLAGVIPQQQLALSAGPHVPGLFDLDLDGELDLLTINQGGGNTTCFLNMGGMLADGVDHDAAASPASLATGDIDEDGDLDLVVVHASADDLGVLLNDGLGGLGPEVLLGVDDDPRGVALADLDSDGHLDLAVAHAVPGMLVLHRGMGDGTFAAGPSLAAAGPTDLYVTELNGDGVPDIVVARPNDSAVQVLVSAP